MLRALMICDSSAADQRQTLLDHMSFLDHAPPGAVSVTYIDLNTRPAFDERWLEADFAVLHTTVLCYRWHRRLNEMHGRLQWLSRFGGVIAAMPQDEYDHALVLDEWLTVLGTNFVVSCFDATHRALMYPRMHRRAHFMVGLTGYLHSERVREARQHALPHAQRTSDLFYRARNLPFNFGWLGYIKGRLGIEAPRVLAASGLRMDISVRAEDTLLGDRWLRTLGSSIATLGSQSGSSVLDRRGEMTLHLRALVEDQPDLSFADADVLCGGELTRYHFAALGPRHLEAVMTRTVQVLVEGEYSGVLKPWVHYLPIRRDLSDLARLPSLIRNRSLMQRISEQAYADFVESGAFSYETFAKDFLRELEVACSRRFSAHGDQNRSIAPTTGHAHAA